MTTDSAPDAHADATETLPGAKPPGHPAGRPLRWRPMVLVLLLVGGLLFLAQQQWRIFSPDRVGSSHRVTISYDECLNDRPLRFDGADWSATEPWPSTWPPRPSFEQGGRASVSGTLHITSKDSGTFTADQGGSVEMRRFPAPEYYNLVCAIQ